MTEEIKTDKALAQTIDERTATLADEYSDLLFGFIKERIPPILSDGEYAARSAALMISFNRNLAIAAAQFGEVHRIEPIEMSQLVGQQFVNNYERHLQAIRAQETLQ